MSKSKSENSAISRRDSREQAFVLLFELDFSKDEFSLDVVLENAVESRDLEFSPYAVQAAKGVMDNKERIDGLISSNLKQGWKLTRISKVSLAVLRLAVYEMLFEDEIPPSVSINEGVELAKKYTVDESPFVNGVLGSVYRELGL